MKVFFRRIHLYLSLAAGAVILIACLTGAVLVFEKDLQMAFNQDRYYVEPASKRLPLDTLTGRVLAAFPNMQVTSVKVYADPERSAEIGISPARSKEGKGSGAPKGPGEQAGAKGGATAKKEAPAGGRAPGFTVFLNPYTGAVLEKYSYQETFFYQVFALHRWLLGGQNSIGKLIVGVSTFMFLFILITGLILWWPRTRNVLKQRLKIKWSGGWKRLNHDFHIVLGFYSCIFLFIFAFTGLAWSFEWFNKGIYTVTNSPMKNPEPPKADVSAGGARIDVEKAFDAAYARYPDAQFVSVSIPRDSASVYTVSVLPKSPAHESATDAVYVDPYGGAIVGELPFASRSAGARVRSFFKPVHTGSLWGTPSKIIAFITCLFGVSFPITGVILWLNRTRTKKKKGVRAVQEAELV